MGFKTLAAVVVLLSGMVGLAQGGIIYVDADAAGSNNGTSWVDAYTFLQDALSSASDGDEIHVAQGVYLPDCNSAEPDGTGDREATFQLLNGVTLKGGYAGFGEPDPNARDFEVFETILSGDLDGNDVDINDLGDFWDPNRAENSYHVVTGSGVDETAVLDGFTITGGSDKQGRGGGMYTDSGSPTVISCTFSDNEAGFGGGMCNEASRPMVKNCTFINNLGMGGGMYNKASRPTVTGCTFIKNYGEGGGMYNEESSLTVSNCTFSDNRAWYQYHSGGGMYNMNSSPTVTGCTFSGNSSGFSGGGIYCEYDGFLTIKNSIIEGNVSHRGGGICCYRSSLTIENSVIRGNRVGRGHEIGSAGLGGGIYCYKSSVTIADSEITHNRAIGYGGGIYSRDSELLLVNNSITANEAIGLYGHGPGQSAGISCSGPTTIINNTIVGNRARAYISPTEQAPGKGGGIHCSSNLTLVSSIIWDNRPDGVRPTEEATVQITHCDIQGGWPGAGNIEADPCFAEPGYWDPNGTPDDGNDDFWVDGDYHLKSQAGRWDANSDSWVQDDVMSPCIDAGDPMSPIGPEPFPNGGIINMGAFGGTAEASKSYFDKPPCEIIVAGDINGDCEINFKDFWFIGLHWLVDNTPLLPGYASSPDPNDGAVGINRTPVLSWEAGSDTASHDVYFGTSSPGTFQGNEFDTTFKPGILSKSTTYYWRIDEVNPAGTTTGPVWSFETGAFPDPANTPDPYNGATGISRNPVLKWQAGAGATSHNVYFGKVSPGEFQRNQTENTFSPDTLSDLTTYYWRIDEVNDVGTTTGSVWSFTTEDDGGGR